MCEKVCVFMNFLDPFTSLYEMFVREKFTSFNNREFVFLSSVPTLVLSAFPQ